MKHWEYATCYQWVVLESLGKDGWELVSTTINSDNEVCYYLKRELKNEMA